MTYSKVTSELVRELARICGERNVVIEDTDALENYASDEAGRYYSHMPDLVVKPSSTEEISGIMKVAHREKIPVTVRGAGSGLAGGAIPIHGGIVLSTERFDRVLEIDKENLAAVVEPGVITNDLCKMLEQEGLYYAGYPMSVETSTIGGNVACNAGGGTVIRYGNTGHHVLGLEVVLANGEVLTLGGKRRKDTNGYNLVQLMVGSEGTLAIITKITLALLPQPGVRVSLLAAFPDIATAIGAVPSIITASKSMPISLELMDKITVELISKYLNDTLPAQDVANAYLITQVEGRTTEDAEGLYELVAEACLEADALDVFVMDSRAKNERIWKFRMNTLEAYKSHDPYVGGEEVVVPTSEIPRITEKILQVAGKYNAMIAVAGHVGDGNLHMGVFKPGHVSVNDWPALMDRIMVEIYEEAKEVGGAVSGEHGVGFVKLPFQRVLKSPAEFRLMRGIKEAFDPHFILNPGKVFCDV